MTPKEKEYWGNTPQHTIDFANEQCRKNREHMKREEEEREARAKSREISKDSRQTDWQEGST